MRVAYFTESLYPLVDGVSRTLARLFSSLERLGVEFTVFSPFVPAEGEVSWGDRVRRVPFVHFPPYPDYRVSLPYSHGMKRDLHAFRPDLVHVASPTPLAFRAQRLARDMGVPVVGSFHTHFVSYFRYYGIGRFEAAGWAMLRRFYRGCARVYPPSASIARELEAHGIGPVEVWSRGIDLRGFSPTRRDEAVVRAAGGGDGVPVLLMVSRLVKEKDLRDLVAIDAILRSRSVRFSLALVGDGPLRAELEEALPDARFAGHRSGDDLARWYASADVFLFPSSTETLGNVVLEALASGLPAIVTDRGGPQDLIDPGSNGFIARANDIADLADHAQRLLEDADLRRTMARQARESAASRDWEEINAGLVRSYADVIGSAAGGGSRR